MSYPTYWPYGLILPQRLARSRAYVPGPRERARIPLPAYPYWHVLDAVPLTRDSADNQAMPEQDTTVVGIVGTASSLVAISFRLELGQVLSQTAMRKWTRGGVDQPNIVGTAAFPFYFRHPLRVANLQPLLARVINMVAATNTVQVCLFGFRRRGATAR